MSQLPILVIGGAGKAGARVNARNSRVADGIEQALGRPARDFSDYARKTTATGVGRA